MSRKLLSLVVLSSLGAFGALGGRARADETATIRNDSTHVVPMYLKWSHLPLESQILLLAPGQVYSTRGPDGSALFIRFNATPGNGQFPKELKYQVITRFTADQNDPGAVSTFRNVSPFEVNLF